MALSKRLPDIYYTRNKLEGTREPEAGRVTPQFFQGEDVVLDIYLNYEGEPVRTEDWDIEVILKKSKYSVNKIWVGELNNGLYTIDNIKGFYKIIVPSQATTYFLAGTYWIDIKISEKLANFNGVKDLDIVIARQPIQLDYTAASPYPESSSHLPSLTRSNTEQTGPPPVDVTKTP